MRWLKVAAAAREWCGGVNPKILYRAVREGRLEAARIGSGRNFLVSEQAVDRWLSESARA